MNTIDFTERQAWEHIKEIERSYDLFKYQIDGWSLWRLFRFPISVSLQNLPFPTRAPQSFWQKIARLAVQTVRFCTEIPVFLSASPAQFLFLTYSSGLAERVEGKYKDVYFDDFIPNIPSFYKLEIENNDRFVERKRNALFKVHSTTFPIEFLSRFSFLTNIQKTAVEHVAIKFNQCVHECGLSSVFSKDYFKGEIQRFLFSKKLFKSLLKKVSPKCVCIADTGELGLSAAAMELGIKVFEFQHGIFNRFHPDALSDAASLFRKSSAFRDRIFLFGKFWKDELQKNGFYNEELVVVGSPRIDSYRRKKEDRATKRDLKSCNIVLTMQNMDTLRVLKFIQEFMNIAKTRCLQVSLKIKLHPIQESSKDDYFSFFQGDDRVQVLFGNEEPNTFELLSSSDFHVSIASACHYDAIGIGTPTIILPFSGHETVGNLFKAGHAFLPATPEELLKIVQQPDHHFLSKEISNYYFEPCSTQNIRDFLHRQELRCDSKIFQDASKGTL
jgi:hypothetical protein